MYIDVPKYFEKVIFNGVYRCWTSIVINGVAVQSMQHRDKNCIRKKNLF
jgi:hypothetical protein